MNKQTIKALKEFAAAVGAKIKKETPYVDGEHCLVLYDADGEPVATEHDSNDMVDTLTAYYGSHERFAEAKQEYETSIEAN